MTAAPKTPPKMPPVMEAVTSYFNAVCSHVAAHLGGKEQQQSGLGEFEITDPPSVLGEGGYGRVLLGRHRRSGAPVAIKELRADDPIEGSKSSSTAASVVREVSVLRKVATQAHPNVAAFLGYFDRGGSHYIVTACCTGGELFKQVEAEGALPEARCRRYFAGIVAGLAHLHAHGVAHRDLKLENVLLDAADNPRLIDLGLAHAHAAGPEGWEKEALTHYCGSKSYCPPEVMARLPYDGFHADLWSLGVCLFACAAGFFPVEEATKKDWRFQRLARVQLCGQPNERGGSTRLIFSFYQRPCPLSPELTALLDELLQLQPKRRLPLPAVASSKFLAPCDAAGTQRPARGGGHAQQPVRGGGGADRAQAAAGEVVTVEASVRGAAAADGVRARPAIEVEVSLDSIDARHRSALGSGAGDVGEEAVAPGGAAPPVVQRQCACSHLAE